MVLQFQLTPSALAANREIVDWSTRFNRVGIDSHAEFPITALIEFDNSLIVAGTFDAAGGVPAKNIARWDGEVWQPMGAGLDLEGSGWGSVFDFAIYEGSLVAGGEFTRSGGREVQGVARWNGSAWEPLGTGIDGIVSDLAVFRGQLVAAWRNHLVTGDWYKDRISIWNGTEWIPILEKFEICCQCVPRPEGRLAVYQDELYAAGNFGLGGDLEGDVIAHWDGTKWTRASGFEGPVCALQVYDDKLITGGRWSSALFSWDGTAWTRVGGEEPPWTGDIYTMAVLQGKLFVVGWFSKKSRLALDDIPIWQEGEVLGELITWDGAHWQHFNPEGLPGGPIFALTTYRGEVVVGGEFPDNGRAPLHHVARWDGAEWHPIGSGAGLDVEGSFSPSPEVRALEEYQGSLIVGGRFDYAGDSRAHSIASWNGTGWSAMQEGIDGVIEALQSYGGKLVAAGTFLRVGQVETENIAAWDGLRWSDVGGGIHRNAVHALTVYGGKLVVGGSFHEAGGRTAHGVVSWDGTSWSRMGFGLFWDVRQLVVHESQLFAAGGFNWNGQDWLSGIARWDGTNWVRLDADGPDPEVESVVSMQEGLLALLRTRELRLWDGTSWREWQPLPASFEIRSLGVYDGQVFVCAHEKGTGLQEALMMWDGNAWQSIALGIDGKVLAFQDYDESLHIGGSFRRVGPHASSALARWQGHFRSLIEPESSEGLDDESTAPTAGESVFAGTRLLPAIESFAGTVNVHYDLAKGQTSVQLRVYDVRGRLVRTLVDEVQDRGRHSLLWDRRDAGGRHVSRGTYFLQLRTSDVEERHTRKFLLLQ